MNRHALEGELRAALEEEIAHLQKTQSERTVAAVGGSRSGMAGPWVLYVFQLERDFLVPDSTPVTARIGNEPFNAQIVAIRGMEMTLGLQRDLGPSIARVEVSVDPTAILERILARLGDPSIASLSDALAQMVFAYQRPQLGQAEFTAKIQVRDEQRYAIQRAIGSQVQFVWGPPGTGKTQTLAALCEVLVELGESVLLTSHTNVAVDEAMLRAAGPDGPLFETLPYKEGKLLRYGTPKHPNLAQIEDLSAEAIAERLASHIKVRLAEVSGELEGVRGERDEVQSALDEWQEAERFTAELRSRQRALDGAVDSLHKRRHELANAQATLERAQQNLASALNPRGLRRIFRKDPRALQFAVNDADRQARLASESLSTAEAWERKASSSLEEGEAHASKLTPTVPQEQAQSRAQELDLRTGLLEHECRHLQEEIDGFLEMVIREAQFVATTLTRAAVDEVIAKRSFDTVIIDEASMAPLPLVYLLALVARKRMILVGDFRQLPPIVQSPEANELAQRWLGRDIFQQAGLDYDDLPEGKREMRADLWEQFRMAPAIRRFASEHFYGGKLKDAFAGERPNDRWWAERLPAGGQVCFVDTAGLGAWSQRSPGGRPSKFNVYSALVATELAAALVEGEDVPEGDPDSHRVGIITPYRAQANLLGILLKDRDLSRLVHAGTVHSFQGTESDVIILDYVEDEPYWKAGPLLLGQGERLMNVAVTRAKHRLFVLGSYAHVRQNLKRSKLWDLVQYAHTTRVIEAGDFLKADFHRAVAEASARISHGTVSDLDADHLRVLNERDFFAALDYDLARARSRVVLFSPFLGRRAADVMPRLKVCVDSGVDVYVVTLPLADVDDLDVRSFYAATHQRLEKLGVRLVFFREMHQKLIFIDDHVLYVGGLNPLSHRHTAEIMDRWDSKDVSKAHAEQVRLNDLLAMWDDPSDASMRSCPRDGAPLLIVAPVTYQDYDSTFWGCSIYPKCDYKRRFSFGPRRSGARVCDQCGAAMHLERKPAAVWWVCGQCRTRRKIQEGESTATELARVQRKSSTNLGRPASARGRRPPWR